MAVNSTPPVQLDPSQDQGHQIAFINQNFQSLANSLNPFILSDGTNNRLLIGKDSAGNYVVKVSKAGFDAFNAANANLIFNSNQDVFKIVGTGTASFTGGTKATGVSGLQQTFDFGTSTIAHNLGFVPGIVAFSTSSTGVGFYQPWPGNPAAFQASSALIIDGSSIYADSTNTYTNYHVNTISYGAGNSIIPDITVKFYLLQETAN